MIVAGAFSPVLRMCMTAMPGIALLAMAENRITHAWWNVVMN